ncbi:MAG: tetratricopeptide repeat protein [Dokdonella sp.]|uniref:YfgM family protein n=1 Tax=Dokdonella sp. TaxID=2291710 RepID=UPI002B6B35C7|nr:tetratricopeptide repeat protein [Dokdonella sp.]HOX70758.1 tetratricopeptide repeat protein [Dokdonella sp.]HPG95138.1 tetratricopeptide repeat protein [Dokdonella sp.]HPN79715.1 tetratricopeptide repeat protein [Dokdonella sp.]
MAFEVLDEHEQGELVRKWLRANAMSILIGIAIGLLLIFGFQQWKARELRSHAEAATSYGSFIEAVEAKKADDAAAVAATLRKDYPSSPYAVLAAMRQAEIAVEKGDLAAAAADLDWADKTASESSMKSLIVLRQARVSLALGEADKALAQLDRVAKSDYPALAGELRGDVLAKLGRIEDARAAYQEALSHLDMQSPGRTFVEMKLGDLSAAAEKQKS